MRAQLGAGWAELVQLVGGEDRAVEKVLTTIEAEVHGMKAPEARRADARSSVIGFVPPPVAEAAEARRSHAGAAAALALLLAVPVTSGCAALRTNEKDLVCGVRDACVVCEGEMAFDGVSRQVTVTYCEDAAAAATVEP